MPPGVHDIVPADQSDVDGIIRFVFLRQQLQLPRVGLAHPRLTISSDYQCPGVKVEVGIMD